MLTIENVTLAYGANPVVRDVTFSVTEGQVFVIIGPNGAGKSSILRAVSGLLVPSKGDIRFRGRSLCGMRPAQIVRMGVSLVPEGRRLFPEMSVLDNLLVGASVHIRERDRVHALLQRTYELFPILCERRKQPAGTLSGGEQQQLAIARGLMSDPTLLLMDEPTLGLAPVVINVVRETFEGLREIGLTIVLAEQNADFALRVGDAGVVISSGELSMKGDIHALRQEEGIHRAYLGV
jgi:branched-chain amino acid transport system ATP-binding protein